MGNAQSAQGEYLGDGPTPDEVAAVTRNRAFAVVVQPIVDLSSGRWIALEALSRFGPPYYPTAAWFRAAEAAGLSTELELLTAQRALGLLGSIPEEISISINFSVETFASGEVTRVIRSFPQERIIIELGEASEVHDCDALEREAQALQLRGVRLAIDDIGAGWCRLQQLVVLRPDMLKLDRSLVSNVGRNLRKQSLIGALTRFASEMRTEVVAEGVETVDELNALLSLGITFGQGWLTGRPVGLEVALAQLSLLRASGVA